MEALLSHSVEYRRTYLTAMIAVMAGVDCSSSHHLPQLAPVEEPVLPECLSLLLGNLEDQQGGPEFLSQALCSAGLLLSRWPDSRFLCALLLLHFIKESVPNRTTLPATLTLFTLCAKQAKDIHVPALVQHPGVPPFPRGP